MILKKKTIKTENQVYIYSGTGNRFAIVYAADLNSKKIKHKKMNINFIKKICQKHKVDGFVKINQDHKIFVWDFYNSDGSYAAFCGNAARCVSDLIRIKTKHKSGHFFAGKLKVNFKIKKKEVTIQYFKKITKKNVTLTLASGKQVCGKYLDTGVPHFVVLQKKDKKLAAEIRKHNYFNKTGTNVTFITNLNKLKMNAVTFERGVEDFTLACGTGSIAAASAMGLKKSLIKMPGGVLKVELKNSEIKLTGRVALLKKAYYEEI